MEGLFSDTLCSFFCSLPSIPRCRSFICTKFAASFPSICLKKKSAVQSIDFPVISRIAYDFFMHSSRVFSNLWILECLGWGCRCRQGWKSEGLLLKLGQNSLMVVGRTDWWLRNLCKFIQHFPLSGPSFPVSMGQGNVRKPCGDRAPIDSRGQSGGRSQTRPRREGKIESDSTDNTESNRDRLWIEPPPGTQKHMRNGVRRRSY